MAGTKPTAEICASATSFCSGTKDMPEFTTLKPVVAKTILKGVGSIACKPR
jgi:hypothetical protein